MSEGSSILVVDDEQSARETIEALLRSEGYQLYFAAGGELALELMRTYAVDAVICDVMMPEMDGFDFCRRVRADERFHLIPIILCTALDADTDVARGLEAGANDFISKPISGVVLRARVRAMLRVQSNYDELRAGSQDVEELIRARREQIMERAGLTAREREVLELLLLGRSHEDVATVLGLSPRTSRFHQGRILRKLGAESRADLARIFL